MDTWRGSGLPATQANAVYGSRDRRNRINRRVSKATNEGTVVTGGAYDAYRTSVRHDEIEYVPRYQGMSAEEVNAAIMSLLKEMEEEDEEETSFIMWNEVIGGGHCEI